MVCRRLGRRERPDDPRAARPRRADPSPFPVDAFCLCHLARRPPLATGDKVGHIVVWDLESGQKLADARGAGVLHLGPGPAPPLDRRHPLAGVLTRRQAPGRRRHAARSPTSTTWTARPGSKSSTGKKASGRTSSPATSSRAWSSTWAFIPAATGCWPPAAATRTASSLFFDLAAKKVLAQEKVADVRPRLRAERERRYDLRRRPPQDRRSRHEGLTAFGRGGHARRTDANLSHVMGSHRQRSRAAHQRSAGSPASAASLLVPSADRHGAFRPTPPARPAPWSPASTTEEGSGTASAKVPGLIFPNPSMEARPGGHWPANVNPSPGGRRGLDRPKVHQRSRGGADADKTRRRGGSPAGPMAESVTWTARISVRTGSSPCSARRAARQT